MWLAEASSHVPPTATGNEEEPHPVTHSEITPAPSNHVLHTEDRRTSVRLLAIPPVADVAVACHIHYTVAERIGSWLNTGQAFRRPVGQVILKGE
jgi:hypothetical protein